MRAASDPLSGSALGACIAGSCAPVPCKPLQRTGHHCRRHGAAFFNQSSTSSENRTWTTQGDRDDAAPQRPGQDWMMRMQGLEGHLSAVQARLQNLLGQHKEPGARSVFVPSTRKSRRSTEQSAGSGEEAAKAGQQQQLQQGQRPRRHRRSRQQVYDEQQAPQEEQQRQEQASLQELELQLASAAQRLEEGAQLAHDQEQLTQQVAQLQLRADSSEAEAEALAAHLAAVQAQLSEASARLAEHRQLQMEHDKLCQDLYRLRSQLQRAQAAGGHASSELTTLTQRHKEDMAWLMQEHRAELSSVNEHNKQLEDESSALRLKLAELQGELWRAGQGAGAGGSGSGGSDKEPEERQQSATSSADEQRQQQPQLQPAMEGQGGPNKETGAADDDANVLPAEVQQLQAAHAQEKAALMQRLQEAQRERATLLAELQQLQQQREAGTADAAVQLQQQQAEQQKALESVDGMTAVERDLVRRLREAMTERNELIRRVQALQAATQPPPTPAAAPEPAAAASAVAAPPAAAAAAAAAAGEAELVRRLKEAAVERSGLIQRSQELQARAAAADAAVAERDALTASLRAAEAATQQLQRQLTLVKAEAATAAQRAAQAEAALSAAVAAHDAKLQELRGWYGRQMVVRATVRRGGAAAGASPAFTNCNRYWVPTVLLFDFMKSWAAREAVMSEAQGFLSLSLMQDTGNGSAGSDVSAQAAGTFLVRSIWSSAQDFEAWSGTPASRRVGLPQGVYQWVPAKGEGYPEDFLPFKTV